MKSPLYQRLLAKSSLFLLSAREINEDSMAGDGMLEKTEG